MTDAEPADGGALDELVFELLERRERSGRPAEQVLEELCAEHPDEARSLRAAAGALFGAGLLAGDARGAQPPRETLGEFRLLRRLGGGGMGVVWLAEEPGLGRRVALKVIRSDRLEEEGARARFRREVQAVARLSHPGVVPIFAVGESEGLPWCSHELVDGATLEELLAALPGRQPTQRTGADLDRALLEVLARRAPRAPSTVTPRFAGRTWVDACLGIAREVASALEHAHARGVVHRDVKPSNVMLSADGRVRLVDFGLASLRGADRLTRTGSQLGSLPYMPPEELEGSAREPAPTVDVYGLGVTLYELLALRHPFFSRSAERTRQLILEARPPSLRELDVELPRDVETVCLHAMERDPARRYASAAALGRDLDHLLARRPIEARPTPRWLRARRWCQRNPAAAVASVMGLLLFTLGPLGWAVNTSWALRRVRAESERAERHFDRAFDAVAHVLHATARDGLEQTPQLQLARLDAIDRALELVVDLERERPDDARVRLEHARLLRSRGNVLSELGRGDEALSALEESAAVHAACAVLGADTLAARRDIAAAIYAMGRVHQDRGELEQALAAFERCASEGEALAALPAPPADLAFDLASLACARADVLIGLGRADDARSALERCAATLDGCDPAERERAVWLEARARVEGALGDLALVAGDLERALGHEERALAWLEQVTGEAARDRDHRAHLALVLGAVARLTLDLGDSERSAELVGEAIEMQRALARDFPEHELYGRHLAGLLSNAGHHARLAGDHGEVVDLLSEASEIAVELIAQRPDHLGLYELSGLVHANLSNVLALGERPLEALEPADVALAHLPRAVAAAPGRTELRGSLTLARYSRALALALGDRADEAREAAEAYELVEREHALAVRFAADLWAEQVACLRRTQHPGADRDAREAEAVARMYDAWWRAVDLGWRDLANLEASHVMNPFRDDPEYRRLVEALAADAR